MFLFYFFFQALCKFLQQMQADLRLVFPHVTFPSRDFPCLRGCDDFINRISSLSLESSLFTQTVLLSGDFGDAYTRSQIPRLQASIHVLGEFLKYTDCMITLIQQLVALIFENCIFFTPFGLFRQGKK